MAWAFLRPVSLLPQQVSAGEYQVKALYLFNFTKFVKWPSDASVSRSSSFAICVLGADPFGSVLATTLSGEVVENKRVVTRRISRVQDAEGCGIVFIGSIEGRRVGEELKVLHRMGALTVSDMPGFARNGGMVGFFLQDNNVRFEINITATQSWGLDVSSELLRVAARVIQAF